MAKWFGDLVRSAGGRKFIMGLMAMFWMKGLNTFILWEGKISEASYVKLEDVLMWIVLGLFAANVVDKKFDLKKDGE
jgi:hypothetical protein